MVHSKRLVDVVDVEVGGCDVLAACPSAQVVDEAALGRVHVEEARTVGPRVRKGVDDAGRHDDGRAGLGTDSLLAERELEFPLEDIEGVDVRLVIVRSRALVARPDVVLEEVELGAGALDEQLPVLGLQPLALAGAADDRVQRSAPGGLDHDGGRRPARRPVEDRLDVVPVGVERVGGVVAGVVGPLPGGAVVATAGGEGRFVKAVDGLAAARLEGEVEASGRLPVVAHEELVGGEVALAFHDELAAERLEHGGVEALARLEVGDAQMHVVEEPAEVVFGHRRSLASHFLRGAPRPTTRFRAYRRRARAWRPERQEGRA